MAILVQQSEVTAAYRRMYFHCVDATDGITAEVGENGGQPQYSLNGGAWGNTTNVLVAIGNGRYYVEMVAATEVNALGIIEGRYKSANTAESVGATLQVVPYDPYTDTIGDSYAIVNHADYGNAKLVRSTTPANKLDVSGTGEAGLDFANIKDAAAHTTIDISVNVALATTLAVRTSDSVFTINAGSAVNDAYNNMVLALYDVTGTLWETRRISDYVGASKTVTVDTAFTFVVAANDVIKIYMNAYAPTVAAGGGATAAQVWDYDVSGVTTQGYAGTYQKIAGGRYG